MNKKILSALYAIAVVLLLSSCASLPKKVKQGDTLVFGRAQAYLHGYNDYEDVVFNGFHRDGLELQVKNVATGKIKKVLPDNDGYFFITGLTPDETYCISWIKIHRHGRSGASQWIEWNLPNAHHFKVFDQTVVNVGILNVDLNGNTNYGTWKMGDFGATKYYFESLEEDSEWMSAKMVNQ